MDDKSKHASSFQIDQEILDARGINMTVEEVSGLSTVRYSERVQALRLNDEDSAFLKGLRRRIKNRLASQNSRRRSVEHLRRLNKELRAVRACKGDAVSERRVLLRQREVIMRHCRMLREHVEQILHQRSDPTTPPSIELPKPQPESLTHPTKDAVKPDTPQTDQIFEFPIERLIQQNVNRIFRNDVPKSIENPKKIIAKTVFLSESRNNSQTNSGGGFKEAFTEECGGVLNLSVKENGRKGHGRKQSAPRRVVYAFGDADDSVLDLKIKKEDH